MSTRNEFGNVVELLEDEISVLRSFKPLNIETKNHMKKRITKLKEAIEILKKSGVQMSKRPNYEIWIAKDMAIECQAKPQWWHKFFIKLFFGWEYKKLK